MAYISINIEGGMFPQDLLDEIAIGKNIAGQKTADFGISDTSRIFDEIQSAFSDSRLHWESFQTRLAKSRENTTTITRQNWMVPLLVDLLGFSQLNVQKSSAIAEGQSYFISHRDGNHTNATPVHISSMSQDLDHRNGTRRSPHATVQEYLNRTNPLWGIVSNGKTLRLLRDTALLSKPTYIEFDLEAMINGNLYNEFTLFYRLLHATRFPKDFDKPEECLLENYYGLGIERGTRIRDKLRNGVESAINILGKGFITHPRNSDLRTRIDDMKLDSLGFYRQILRLIYRFLFLMVAEERKLLFSDSTLGDKSHVIYNRYYSIGQLRDRADRYFYANDNVDLWEGLKQTFRLFRDDKIASSMGLSALNGELFGENACIDFEGAYCTNQDLLRAIRELSIFRTENNVPMRVNYRDLNVEELGSVYESLLDFRPVLKSSPPSFELATGSERKTTGSYYTPPELVHELIKSALVPVIQDRVSKVKGKEEKERALLGLRVCDPASGSGHFMLSAARRIARELAIVREGESEPTPTVYREALRDVIRSCIYAVDKNPLAVDLCKVALWIEGHNPGLPLSFLDNHIKCGDSLVGIFDMDVLEEGIPNDAYKPVTGDDKAAATTVRKQNQEERKSIRQLTLGESMEEIAELDISITENFRLLGDIPEEKAEDVNTKEDLYDDLRRKGSDWWKLKVACDLWTSAFFMRLQQENAFHMEGVPTTGSLRRYMKTGGLNYNLLLEVEKISETHQFFHWKLEFPDVFEKGGFDVLLGNPPWERIKLQEKEFFEVRDQEIANASTSADRVRLIEALIVKTPQLAAEYAEALRGAEVSSKFIRGSGRAPLTSRGDINIYSIFAETMRIIGNPTAQVSMIVPTGIATDDSTKYFFGDLVERQSLVTLFDFENKKKIFKGVERNIRFCLLTVSNTISSEVRVGAQLDDVSTLSDPSRINKFSRNQLVKFNPNTLNLPMFRTSKDAHLVDHIHSKAPVLVDESKEDDVNPWGISFKRIFDMSNDSGLFVTLEWLKSEDCNLQGNIFTRGSNKYLPLYEAKLANQFDHRAATFEGIIESDRFKTHAGTNKPTLGDYSNPNFVVVPRYWVVEGEFNSKIEHETQWLMGFRNTISAMSDSRSLVASILPLVPVGNSLPVIFTTQSVHQSAALFASLNSFVIDYVLRQKVSGSNLNFYILKQLPVLTPSSFIGKCEWSKSHHISGWLASRILELSYTAWDIQPFAIDMGYEGPPFRWDEGRRFLLRCELDAAFFHLYGIEREDVDYIIETFPIVKRNDERDYGEYRTKRVILEIYDEMANAIETGQPNQTRLDPPPADPRVAHDQLKPKEME